jgi:hypothetical protein
LFSKLLNPTIPNPDNCLMAMRLYSNVLANVLNQSSKDLDMTPFQVHVSKNYFLRKFIFIVVKVKSK